MREFNIFSHERLTETTWVVRETYGPNLPINIYVIVGSDRVAVIDSGMAGTGGLRRYIEANITEKRPMLCYMTHGHMDHIGAAILFDERYLNRRDHATLEHNLRLDRRFNDIRQIGASDELLAFCRESYLRNEHMRSFRDVDDSDIIELGDVTLEVMKLPGHSPGALTYYNRHENYLIASDTIQSFGGWGRCDLEGFKQNLACLERILAAVDEGVTIYNGHELTGYPIRLALDLKAALTDVIAGRTQGDAPYQGLFTFPPKPKNVDTRAHKVGLVTLSYDANKLPFPNSEGSII